MSERQARQRRLEDDVLAQAAALDPADQSIRAKAVRETARSIQDHRASPPSDGRSQ